MADAFTIEVDGWTETLKWLGKVDKEIKKEAVDVLRDGAKKVQSEALLRMAATPGVRRSSYPLTRGAIPRRASPKGASVGINRDSSSGRNAAIFGAEFGSYVWHVPRGNVKGRKARGLSQNSMKRRTFPVWRGNNTTVRGKKGPGWIVLPTLRKWVPKIEGELEKDLNIVIQKGLRKAGVPRG